MKIEGRMEKLVGISCIFIVMLTIFVFLSFATSMYVAAKIICVAIMALSVIVLLLVGIMLISSGW